MPLNGEGNSQGVGLAMRKHVKSKEQLLLEAAAVVEEARKCRDVDREDIGNAALGDTYDAARKNGTSPADEVLNKYEHLRELEKQLCYVKWLRSQNKVRMRDTMQYTK